MAGRKAARRGLGVEQDPPPEALLLRVGDGSGLSSPFSTSVKLRAKKLHSSTTDLLLRVQTQGTPLQGRGHELDPSYDIE